jgi:hypothetical protein
MAMAASLSRTIFRLSTRELPSEVTLTPAAWRVLVQFDGQRSLADVARGLGMEEPLVAQITSTLLHSGMLQVASGEGSPALATVSTPFFDRLTTELARAVGPLAVLTLEDEILALSETRDGFPRDRAPELVERLSLTIQDDARRLKFQQVMLEAIRKL